MFPACTGESADDGTLALRGAFIQPEHKGFTSKRPWYPLPQLKELEASQNIPGVRRLDRNQDVVIGINHLLFRMFSAIGQHRSGSPRKVVHLHSGHPTRMKEQYMSLNSLMGVPHQHVSSLLIVVACIVLRLVAGEIFGELGHRAITEELGEE